MFEVGAAALHPGGDDRELTFVAGGFPAGPVNQLCFDAQSELLMSSSVAVDGFAELEGWTNNAASLEPMLERQWMARVPNSGYGELQLSCARGIAAVSQCARTVHFQPTMALSSTHSEWVSTAQPAEVAQETCAALIAPKSSDSSSWWGASVSAQLFRHDTRTAAAVEYQTGLHSGGKLLTADVALDGTVLGLCSDLSLLRWDPRKLTAAELVQLVPLEAVAQTSRDKVDDVTFQLQTSPHSPCWFALSGFRLDASVSVFETDSSSCLHAYERSTHMHPDATGITAHCWHPTIEDLQISTADDTSLHFWNLSKGESLN